MILTYGLIVTATGMLIAFSSNLSISRNEAGAKGVSFGLVINSHARGKAVLYKSSVAELCEPDFTAVLYPKSVNGIS